MGDMLHGAQLPVKVRMQFFLCICQAHSLVVLGPAESLTAG